MKILDEPRQSILVDELKEGQIAVITQWSVSDDYIGKIVQRYGDDLITIGGKRGENWRDLFGSKQLDGCLVRILPVGTKLEITQ